MAETETLTIQRLYQLFKPSEPPAEIERFKELGSPECLPPIGPEKPDGLTDYHPVRKVRPQPIRYTKKKEQSAPPKKSGVVSVQSNPKFAGQSISWVKRAKPEPEPEPEPEKKPPLRPEMVVTRPSETQVKVEPKAENPPERKPAMGWGRKKERKVVPFKELMGDDKK